MSQVNQVIRKMIDYSDGNIHDINHFLKVNAFAKIICDGENVNNQTKEIVEVATILHDIACPLCRKKYGQADGKHQEIEGKTLAKEFLKSFNYSEKFIERICFLVSHHHTYWSVDGIDYRILLEADFLVNADEGGYEKEAIKGMLKNVFKTQTGIELLNNIYLKDKKAPQC